MNDKRKIDFLIKFLFLFITFIYVIKQENETYIFVDDSNFAEKTHTGFIVDPDENLVSPFYKYYVSISTQYKNPPAIYINYSINRSILEFSHTYCNHRLVDQNYFLSPRTHILKILHKNNIFHQSSDDKSAQHFYC